MGEKKKWFIVKLETTIVANQYMVVIADDEASAERIAREKAKDHTWHYNPKVNNDNIEVEIIAHKD